MYHYACRIGFPGRRAKPNSLGRLLRLPLPGGTVSMTFCPNLLLTGREILVTIHVTTNAVFTQYNAENSVTNQLAKQLKTAKAVSVYLLDQCSSAINNSGSIERVPNALGAENFHAAITFANQTNTEHEEYRKIFRRSM